MDVIDPSLSSQSAQRECLQAAMHAGMHAVSPKDKVPSQSPESVARDRRHQKHRRQILGSRHGTPAPIHPSVLESRASGPPSLTVDSALVKLAAEGGAEAEAASNSWDGFSFPATPSTCDGDLSPTFSPRVFSPGGNISPHGSSPAFSPRIPSPRLPSGAAAQGAAPGNGRAMESQRRAFPGSRRGAVPPTRLQRDAALVGSPRGDASTSSKAQESQNLVAPNVLSAVRPSATHRDYSQAERAAFQGTPEASAFHSGGYAGSPASRGPLARVRPAASTAAGEAQGMQMRGPRPPSLILPSQCAPHASPGTSTTRAAVRAPQAVNGRFAAAAVSPTASADSAASSPSSFASSPPTPSPTAAAASPSAHLLASPCAESPKLLHPRSPHAAPSPPSSASASPRLLQASRPRAPSAHSSPRPPIPERAAQYAFHDPAELPRAASFHHPPARRRESDAPMAHEAAELARARSFHRPPSQLQPQLSPSAANHTRLPFPILPLALPRSPSHPAPRSCPPARLLAGQPLEPWGKRGGGGREQGQCEVIGRREKWGQEVSRGTEMGKDWREEERENEWGAQIVGRKGGSLQARNVALRNRQPQRRASFSFGGQSDSATWQRAHDGMHVEEADVPMWRLMARFLTPPHPTPPSQAPPSSTCAELTCHAGSKGVAAACNAGEQVGGGAGRRDGGHGRGFSGRTQPPESVQDHIRYSHSPASSPRLGCASGTSSVMLPPPVSFSTAAPTHALVQPWQQEEQEEGEEQEKEEDGEEGGVPRLAVPCRAHSARCTATTAPIRSPLSPTHHHTHSCSLSHLHRSPLNSPTASRSGMERHRGADTSTCLTSPKALPSPKALTASHSSPRLVTNTRVANSPRSPAHSRSQSALNSPTVCHTDPSSSADAEL